VDELAYNQTKPPSPRDKNVKKRRCKKNGLACGLLRPK